MESIITPSECKRQSLIVRVSEANEMRKSGKRGANGGLWGDSAVSENKLALPVGIGRRKVGRVE